jgi:hypothetical protein
MKNLKCAIAGLLPVVVVLVFFPITIHHTGGYGIEVRQPWPFHSPYFWIVIGVAFAIGFSWEQRRLSK